MVSGSEGFFRASLETVRRLRHLVLALALIYTFSFTFGYLWAYNTFLPLESQEQVAELVETQPPFTTVLQALREGDLPRAVLLTFAVNTGIGAFATTTLPGVIPLLGAAVTLGVTFFRGFIIGSVMPEVLTASLGALVVATGTLLLEFTAYSLSGAGGIHLSLSLIRPQRLGAKTRLEAFKLAWLDIARLFIPITLLLAIGALWEMAGLYLLLP